MIKPPKLPVYVAGKTHDFREVRVIQDIVRRCGGEITHDWTHAVEAHGPEHEAKRPTFKEARLYAQYDMSGVGRAKLVIAYPSPDWCGTLLEIGAAMALGTPVLFTGQPFQRSVFWALPNVYVLAGDTDALREGNLTTVIGRIMGRPWQSRSGVYVKDELEFLMYRGVLTTAEIEGRS